MKLADLKPNPRNPRKISKEKLEMLKISLTEFGDLSGIIHNVRFNTLTGGNQRHRVLPPDAEIHIERTFNPPTRTGTVAKGTILLDGEPFNYRQVEWDEDKDKAANIAANKHGGEWDLPSLTDWLLELDAANFPMELTGFDTTELENLMAPVHKVEAQCDEDEVPEQVDPKTKRGDIYLLGPHRLMCGDSTQIDCVDKLMNGEKAVLWVTDPPYGVDIKQVSIDRYEKTGRGNTQSSKKEISNDIASKEGWKEVLGMCFSNAYIACSEKASHYVFSCQGSDKQMMMMMMQNAGWNFRHELIWKKNRFILGRSDYHYQHEPILYGWKESGTHEFYGGRDKSSIIETQVYKNDLHPTMKPIELLEQLVENSSKTGQNVFDGFGGSGSTIIACEKTNRRCFMMELDPHYCDVIVARWEKYTGKKAELINDNVTMSDANG